MNIDSGYINLDNAGTKIFIQMDAKSMNTQSAGRDEHLLSADFFDAAKFPHIVFEATEVVKDSTSMEYSYVAKGKLTIKGITKETNVPFNFVGVEMKDMGEHGKYNVGGFEGKTVINRTDFQIGKAGGLGDNVTISINLEVMQEVK
jgi:polyisoprenoid-binding protein YceI